MSTPDGFFANVDGEPVHVQGDSNISDAEFELIARIVRAARKKMGEVQPIPMVTLRDPVTKEEQQVAADAVNRIAILKSVGYVVVDDQKAE